MLVAFLKDKATAFQKNLNRSNIKVYSFLVLVSISIGYGVELIQGNFIYQRYYDLEDVIVNSIGTLFGTFGYTLIGRKIV
jgi:glycopeptide antibiotics resistance protein